MDKGGAFLSSRQNGCSAFPGLRESGGFRIRSLQRRLDLKLSIAMKTRRDIEAAICDGVSRFEQDYFGLGSQHIHAHLSDERVDDFTI
jgi:hypothetical protein